MSELQLREVTLDVRASCVDLFMLFAFLCSFRKTTRGVGFFLKGAKRGGGAARILGDGPQDGMFSVLVGKWWAIPKKRVFFRFATGRPEKGRLCFGPLFSRGRPTKGKRYGLYCYEVPLEEPSNPGYVSRADTKNVPCSGHCPVLAFLATLVLNLNTVKSLEMTSIDYGRAREDSGGTCDKDDQRGILF